MDNVMKRLVFIITDTAGSAYSAITEDKFALLVRELEEGGGAFDPTTALIGTITPNNAPITTGISVNQAFSNAQGQIDFTKLNPITFTTVLKFDKNYTSEHTIVGANAFTLDATDALKGNIYKIYMRANGVNKPTFSADFVMQRDNWVNTNNTWNILHFEYTPSGKVSTWITYQ